MKNIYSYNMYTKKTMKNRKPRSIVPSLFAFLTPSSGFQFTFNSIFLYFFIFSLFFFFEKRKKR